MINVVFMPVYGLMAAAWGYLLSYLSMVVFSYYLSRRYYPIPYDTKTILLYFGAGIAIYLLSVFLAPESLALRILLNTLYIIAFVFLVLKHEHIDIQKIKSILIKSEPH